MCEGGNGGEGEMVAVVGLKEQGNSREYFDLCCMIGRILQSVFCVNL